MTNVQRFEEHIKLQEGLVGISIFAPDAHDLLSKTNGDVAAASEFLAGEIMEALESPVVHDPDLI